ncbi:MAG TPA: HNH endonuclease [Clostridiales bacterium]|nr:HNH endonuclease [Clostridiales bacterium]
MKRYNFYATLLDAFQRYLDAESIYEKYFNEKMSFAEYEGQAKQELIDKINRVPFDSDAADKGTAFNELVDVLAHKITSDKITFTEEKEIYTVKYKDREFTFNKAICKAISEKIKGAIPQYFCSADLKVNDNIVNLYGYIDEVKEFDIIDIKTTGSYQAFKFRNNWQHIVYPFCLNESGIHIDSFIYMIVEFTSKNVNLHDEIYKYKESDVCRLIEICDKLILFLEQNKNLITDKKIFNEK